jgi:hypothetical protein
VVVVWKRRATGRGYPCQGRRLTRARCRGSHLAAGRGVGWGRLLRASAVPGSSHEDGLRAGEGRRGPQPRLRPLWEIEDRAANAIS